MNKVPSSKPPLYLVHGLLQNDTVMIHNKCLQLGIAIKGERKRLSLTQTQLGDRIGISKSQVARIEQGANITIRTLICVLAAIQAEGYIHTAEGTIAVL